LPSDKQNYIVADVQSYGEDEEFMNLVSGVLSASQIILVHITKEDIQEDGKVNLNFKTNSKSKVVYLWRDYDNDMGLLSRVKKSIEGSENELGIIEIPKLNPIDMQSYKVENYKSKAKEMIFKKINSLKFQNCAPIVDLYKTFIQKNFDFDKEIEEIQRLLNESKKDPDGSFTISLLPCLYQDCKIIEEWKKKNSLLKKFSEEQSESQIVENEKNYDLVVENIEKRLKEKNEVNASKLIQKVIKVIASNQLSDILLLSEAINSWKMPHFEKIRQKFIDINAQKDGGDLSTNGKKALILEIDDKDLSLSTFIDEVLSYYESKEDVKQTLEYQGVKAYLKSCLLQGAPLNLVNSKTLKFGNALFKEIFEQEIGDMKNIFVISIIGAQSSAKSTLLNVLFGCGFSTSAGRCTKGIYISLLHHHSGFKIMVIDTEGLLSVVGRDQEFDNLIATMTFSCSHVIIINNRGEINTKLRDLLEICVYAMKHLNLATIRPKIIFSLRDIVDNSGKTQQEMLLTMKSSLEEAAHKLSININELLDFSQEDIFLLPPAFELKQGDDQTSFQKNNSVFSSRVLEMRQYIFRYLNSINKQSVQNLKFFYCKTEELWNKISERGLQIMKAKNFLEIEVKDKALMDVNEIRREQNWTFMQKGQSILDQHQQGLRENSLDSIEKFTKELSSEFKIIRDKAMSDLEKKIFKNEQYGKVIQHSFNEFKEIIDYNLGWQKLRLVREWNTSLISHESENEVKKLKVDIKEKVDKKIKNMSLDPVDIDRIKEEMNTYFEGLIVKLSTDFQEKIKTLEKNMTQNLPGEIYTHFDGAQIIANRNKERDRVIFPGIALFIERLKENTSKKYDPKEFYQYRTEDSDKERIIKEFDTFVGNLPLLLSDVASDETALKVINDCLSRVQQMETDKVLMNKVAFIQKGLIEAMHFQYSKTWQTETQKLQLKQKEFETVVQEERKYIVDIFEHSTDSFTQGLRCARRWFKDLKKIFLD